MKENIIAAINPMILTVQTYYSDQLAREIVDARAHGFIAKSDSEDLIIAVENLAKHKPFFTSQVAEVISSFNSGGRVNNVPDSRRVRLTAREREDVLLLADGQSNKEAASSLGISVKTNRNTSRQCHA